MRTKSEYQNPKSETNSNNKNTKFKIVSNFVLRISSFNLQAGQSLVEILLVIGLSALILPALLTGLVSSRQGKAQNQQRTQAIYLLNETADAVRSVREKGWSTFAVNGTYYPIISGSSWTLATGSATVNGLTRSITIGDVNRDSGGAIVITGGSLDPSSKKVDISISWGQPYMSTVSASLYITRYLDNNSFTQTTVADFDVGTKSGTVVTNTLGGEVTLGAGGNADWCTPSTSIVGQLDLPKTGKATSVTAVVGEAFAGTGENSSGESFADILISNTDPPIPTLYGTIDGYKTNDIFGEEDYGYIATDSHSKEVVIIRLSSLPFIESGHFNAPGNDFGESIFVLNNIGYVVIKDKLYNFDLSSKNGARPILDTNGVTLSKDGTSVYVVGNYAYVSIKGDNNVQLDIIDISNSSNMIKVGSAKVNNQSAQDVFVNGGGTRAYIVTNATSRDEREFHIVNTQNKSNPIKVGSGYYTNGMSPEGIEVVTTNKAIVVGQGGEEYQVVDISNELNLLRCGGLQSDSGIFDSASVLEPDGDAYTYIVTGDASSEFKIIEGGPGGNYASSGDFTSSAFDATSSAAFNRFDVSVNRPISTDIKFQVAVSQAVSGSCSGSIFNFVGPNATSSAFFTTTATLGVQSFSYPIPSIINPGRCFKYKAYLSTTDPLSTPIFYDMTGNYSP